MSLSGAVSGQRSEPAVGVEHRREREHLATRLRVGDLDSADPILDGLQLGERVRVDRAADRNDELHHADAAEPRFDRVVIADDAGLGPEQLM